jgi:hypothetical protein
MRGGLFPFREAAARTPRRDLLPISWSMRSAGFFGILHLLKEGWEAMKRKRYTEEQIAFTLRQHEGGTAVAEIIRKLGISEQTF